MDKATENGNQPSAPATITKDPRVFAQQYAIDKSAVSIIEYSGLTKREQFAAQILSGWSFELTDRNRPQHYDHAAESSVKLADALLKALEANNE